MTNEVRFETWIGKSREIEFLKYHSINFDRTFQHVFLEIDEKNKVTVCCSTNNPGFTELQYKQDHVDHESNLH